MRAKMLLLFGLTFFLLGCAQPVPPVLTHATDATEQKPIAMSTLAKNLDLTVHEFEDQSGAYYLKDGKGHTITLSKQSPERYQLNFRSRAIEYPGLVWKNQEIFLPIGAYNSICIDLGRTDQLYSNGLKVDRPYKDQVSYAPPAFNTTPKKVVVEQEGITTPTTTTKPVVEKPASKSSLKGLTVVVDAGHGGKDPGGIGVGGIREKDIVLKVSLRLKTLLEGLGAKVLMTRTTDRYLKLEERSGFANKHKADLFISIHANIASRSSAKGVETWFKAGGKRGNLSQTLSKTLNDAAVKAVGANDRGARADQRGLHVLRATKMPAALVELGFMSNPGEAKALAKRDYLNKLADGIADGLVKYYRA